MLQHAERAAGAHDADTLLKPRPYVGARAGGTWGGGSDGGEGTLRGRLPGDGPLVDPGLRCDAPGDGGTLRPRAALGSEPLADPGGVVDPVGASMCQGECSLAALMRRGSDDYSFMDDYDSGEGADLGTLGAGLAACELFPALTHAPGAATAANGIAGALGAAQPPMATSALLSTLEAAPSSSVEPVLAAADVMSPLGTATSRLPASPLETPPETMLWTDQPATLPSHIGREGHADEKDVATPKAYSEGSLPFPGRDKSPMGPRSPSVDQLIDRMSSPGKTHRRTGSLKKGVISTLRLLSPRRTSSETASPVGSLAVSSQK